MGRMIGMPVIGNKKKKKSFGALRGAASGFTMGNEFMQVICVTSGKVAQAAMGVYDRNCLKKVVAGGAFVVEEVKRGVTTWLKKFIPQKVSNEAVLSVLEKEAGIEAKVRQTTLRIPFPSLLAIPTASPFPALFTRSLSAATAETIESHKKYNRNILNQENGTYISGGYIENQEKWVNVKFGKSDMCYSGCEIIAAYNASKALEEEATAEKIVELIAAYEKYGAVLGGKWGTSPYAIENYFRKEGYAVETTASLDTAAINGIGERSDTVIVNAYNNENDITAMIHTVSITKDEGGTYSVHNAYRKDESGNYLAKDGYSTLQEAIDVISNENPKSIYVIGISRQ